MRMRAVSRSARLRIDLCTTERISMMGSLWIVALSVLVLTAVDLGRFRVMAAPQENSEDVNGQCSK